MVVCLCFGVTESDLQRAKAPDMDTLIRETGAGMGCGACLALLENVWAADAKSDDKT